jgi:hypothetical protein
MKGAAVHMEHRRAIRASADEVWKWMCDPAGLALLRASLFHAAEMVGPCRYDQPAERTSAACLPG